MHEFNVYVLPALSTFIHDLVAKFYQTNDDDILNPFKWSKIYNLSHRICQFLTTTRRLNTNLITAIYLKVPFCLSRCLR